MKGLSTFPLKSRYCPDQNSEHAQPSFCSATSICKTAETHSREPPESNRDLKTHLNKLTLPAHKTIDSRMNRCEENPRSLDVHRLQACVHADNQSKSTHERVNYACFSHQARLFLTRKELESGEWSTIMQVLRWWVAVVDLPNIGSKQITLYTLEWIKAQACYPQNQGLNMVNSLEVSPFYDKARLLSPVKIRIWSWKSKLLELKREHHTCMHT